MVEAAGTAPASSRFNQSTVLRLYHQPNGKAAYDTPIPRGRGFDNPVGLISIPPTLSKTVATHLSKSAVWPCFLSFLIEPQSNPVNTFFSSPAFASNKNALYVHSSIVVTTEAKRIAHVASLGI